MSKADRNQREKGKVKFRFIEFELEGSDSTLEESLRNIATAIAKGSYSPRLAAVGHGQALPAQAEGPSDGAATVESDDAAEYDSAVEDAPGEDRPRGPRNYRNPKVLDDLDLTSASIPLKEFCDGKKPDTELKKYLVIAAWLKEHLKVEEVTIDHIYTCYRALGWFPPRDVAQPLRDMKSKQGWFSKGKGKGAYAINHIGLGEVGASERCRKLAYVVTIEDFAASVPNFGDISHADRIRLFAWFLHVHARLDTFSGADISRCYDALHLAPPTSVGPFLTAMVKKRPPELLKDRNGFRLERRLRELYDGKYGRRASTIVVDALLSDLSEKISDAAERGYLDEALKCFRVGAFRASIVMAWNLAYDHLCRWVFEEASPALQSTTPEIISQGRYQQRCEISGLLRAEGGASPTGCSFSRDHIDQPP